MSEPNRPAANSSQPDPKDDRLVDPQDLVYKGGYSKSPREIIETPGAAPEMLEDQAPEDLRVDLIRED